MEERKTVIPVSEETRTILLNIEGILNNLKPILDKETYALLSDVFIKIKDEKESVSLDTADELKKSFPTMWEFYVNMSGSSIRDRLRDFQRVLEPYNNYYILSQKRKKLVYLLENPSKSNDIEAINLTIELIDILKDLNYSLAPELFRATFNTIYKSLVSFDDDNIMNKINEYPLLREVIGRKIQKVIKNPNKSIEDDGLDHASIRYVKNHDKSLRDFIRERENVVEELEATKKYNDSLISEKIEDLIKIRNKIKDNLEDEVNLRKAKIKLIVALYSILPISTLAGYWIGETNSQRQPLYWTETHTTDLSGDTPREIESYSSYDQTRTQYVSTVMIATPWQKTLSGSDVYSREVTYYDFIVPEDQLDSYTLKKEDLIPENLVYKYSVKETGTSETIKDKPSIVVTETFQDKQKTKKNEEAVNTGLAAGFALGLLGVVSGTCANKFAEGKGKFEKYSIYEGKEKIKESKNKLEIIDKNVEVLSNFNQLEEFEPEELKELLSANPTDRLVLKK